MIAFRKRKPPIRTALTAIVMIPMGPVASKKLAAHPIDMEKNCFVGCSPKRVRIGPTAVATVLMKFVQSFPGAVMIGAEPLVLFDGAILQATTILDGSSVQRTP